MTSNTLDCILCPTKSFTMSHNEKGYVYILTNPSFREDWVKIGKSARAIDVRAKELDNTAVPLPFEIFATLETKKYGEVEKLVHKTIDRLTDLRIRQNREFFNIEPKIALDIFYDIANTIEDAKVVEYENNKPITHAPVCEKSSKDEVRDENTLAEELKTRKSRFKFSMVGIRIGETIVFAPTGIEVKVASDDSVEYEGRIYKLSPFVGTFMPADERNTSGAYQGPKYFTYKGKILNDMRMESGL